MKLVIKRIDSAIDGTGRSMLMFLNGAGGPVGFVTLTHRKVESAYLCNLFVIQRYRRRGIAGQIIEECRKIARASRCRTLSLIVKDKNKVARSAYEKLRFIATYHWDDGDTLLSISTGFVPKAPRLPGSL